MMRLLSVLLFLPLLICAQPTYVLDESIPVHVDDAQLTMPWGGGLNSPQFNTLDLNNDGTDDLVIFDRMSNTVRTFLRNEESYDYAAEYQSAFPSDLSAWMLLRDYNCDGLKDIFTGDPLGIRVFVNRSDESGLKWERLAFYSGGSQKSPVLLTLGFSGKINIQLQYDELPSIGDADGDGDVDIFNMRYGGAGTVEFHRNMSVERYGTCDSLDLERVTQTWGNFRECHCGTFAFGGEPCPTGGRTKHAVGQSLLSLDADGDGDLDLLFSQAECTNLYLLTNTGSNAAPVITSSAVFPGANPVDLNLFPAAYYEDVDFDGVKDLLSSPNMYVKDHTDIDLESSSWYYHNAGTNAQPAFNFVRKNFLQHQMIDVGDNAVPVFTDVDADGDLDLFVSRNSGTNNYASVFLFENTGTLSEPAFSLVDRDYLGFSALDYHNLRIQFNDLNRDGKTDFVFTATSGSTTGVYYILNKGGSAPDFQDQPIIQFDFPLTSSENVLFADVDGDGMSDILAGRSSGRVQFWRNIGTGIPEVVLEDPDFLRSEAFARPGMSLAMADLDDDGKPDLAVGDQSGFLEIISDYRTEANRTDGYRDFIFNELGQHYTSINLGGRIWPVIANIYNTTTPSIVAGNTLGGLHVLRNDDGKSLSPAPEVSVYPNPLDRQQSLFVSHDRPVNLVIYNGVGQRVSEPLLLPGATIHSTTVQHLAPGIYILQFSAGDRIVTQRLAIY